MTASRRVGMDVAKDTLTVAVLPRGQQWTVPRTSAGVAQLAEEGSARAPERIVLEASGEFERLVWADLWAAGLPVAVVNPRQARAVAWALGRLAQTDRVDAVVLAEFAARVQPPVRPRVGAPGAGRAPHSPAAAGDAAHC